MKSGQGLAELLAYVKEVSPEVLEIVSSNKVPLGAWSRDDGNKIHASPEIHLVALAMVKKSVRKEKKR